MIDDQLDLFSDDVQDVHLRRSIMATKLRRDPSSTSSMNDSCESGTSSSSLTSLGRSSGEQPRPYNINIWGEMGPCVRQQEDDDNQATPSRRLFSLPSVSAVATHLEMSIKTKQSPSTSPLVAKGRAGHRSPLQVFFMHSPAPTRPSPPAHTPTPPATTRVSKTSFNSLLPRLVSSRKVTATKQDGRSQSCFTSPSNPLIDLSGAYMDSSIIRSGGGTASAPQSRLPTSKSRRNLFQGVYSTTTSTDGRPDRPTVSFDRSLTSEASQGSEPDTSPSRSARKFNLGTSVTSSTSASTETTASSTDSPIEPARAALLARRKTLASHPLQSADKASDRTSSRPSRPSLRRGITDPKMEQKKRIVADLLSPEKLVTTPVSVLFGDEKPSPAAFASTGLVKKRSMTPGSEIPRFGDSEPIHKIAGLPRSSQPIESRFGLMVAHKPTSNRSHALSIVVNNSDRSSPLTNSEDTVASSRSTAAGPSTDASVSVYTRAVPPHRGLRRKTSSMFGPSASVSSIGDGDGACSPATPTKPGMCEYQVEQTGSQADLNSLCPGTGHHDPISCSWRSECLSLCCFVCGYVLASLHEEERFWRIVICRAVPGTSHEPGQQTKNHQTTHRPSIEPNVG